MTLSDCLEPLQSLTLHTDSPSENLELTGLTLDSRSVQSGFLFIAIKGTDQDGHEYIEKAIESGAIAILCERAPRTLPSSVPIYTTSDIRRATSLLAHHFYGTPSDNLVVLGVTGTNGKSTVTYLIRSLIQAKFDRCGLIGTIITDAGRAIRTSTHTTPDAISLHQSLAEMVENHYIGVAIEISSHGIDQQRSADLAVNTVVFTNLTQDHLDYHGSMEEYYQAKKKLFTQLGQRDPKTKPCAIINRDDTYGARLIRELSTEFPLLRQLTYGFSVDCDLRAQNIQQTQKGIEFRIDYNKKSYLVTAPLFGLFNVRNVLSALASILATKLVKMREAIKTLENIPQIPGRLERVLQDAPYRVFVDYAHTPDALKSVCETLKELEPKQLITVFGCGGDRDKEKRPLMATEASLYSTHCIITSDNPRHEDPIKIIKQIETGLSGTSHFSIPDRKRAIQHAITLAQEGDIVLIAGKGHENYQIFGSAKVPFSDLSEAKLAMSKKTNYPTPEPQVRNSL